MFTSRGMWNVSGTSTTAFSHQQDATHRVHSLILLTQVHYQGHSYSTNPSHPVFVKPVP